jgi:S-formylglutathione hydrolase FrmB
LSGQAAAEHQRRLAMRRRRAALISTTAGAIVLIVGMVLGIGTGEVNAGGVFGFKAASPSPKPSATPSTSLSASPSPARTCAPGRDETVSAPDPSAPNGQRTVLIHRPAGPDRADLPVVYVLHGYPGSPQSILNDLGSVLDAAACRIGQPMVLAAPEGRSGDLDTEWGDDSAGRFSIESFVTDTAITLTEGALRRPARLRALVGESMGGYGAAAIALRHPDRYGQVLSFGGYYRVDDPDSVFGTDTSAHAPDQLVTSDTHAQLRFFLVEGDSEDTALMTGSIKGEAERFATLLRTESVTVDVAHPPGGHDDDGWLPALADGVTFLDAGWHTKS